MRHLYALNVKLLAAPDGDDGKVCSIFYQALWWLTDCTCHSEEVMATLHCLLHHSLFAATLDEVMEHFQHTCDTVMCEKHSSSASAPESHYYIPWVSVILL